MDEFYQFCTEYKTPLQVSEAVFSGSPGNIISVHGCTNEQKRF